jgi:hypothetical protein
MRLFNFFYGCVTLASLQLVRADDLETQDSEDQDDQPRKAFVVGGPVKTSSGTVIGHAAGKRPAVSEYLGIRFAQAPVGNLRFAAPKKYINDSTFNAAAFVRFQSNELQVIFTNVTRDRKLSRTLRLWTLQLT